MGDATTKLMRGLLEALLLDSIAREPKHGYALIRELEEVFGAPPNRNQVYPLLNRLEKDGYVQADRAEGRGKTRYTLTGKGLELLKDYRLRTPLFRERAADLWGFAAEGPARDEAPGPAPGPAPPSPSAAPVGAPEPRPHLADRIRLEGEPPAARHGAGPCTAEVVLRRRAGEDRIAMEVAGTDPGCATCQALLRDVRAMRDRWF